jgi:alpha-galactosidase
MWRVIVEGIKLSYDYNMKHITTLFLTVGLIITVKSGFAEKGTGYLDCSAKLENGVLSLENSKILRTYQWNEGNIITSSLTDKTSGKVWHMSSKKPDLALPGETEKSENAVFSTRFVDETSIAPAFLEAEIVCSLGKIEVKRVFRLYPNCPAIACDLYFRGESANTWIQAGTNLADMVNIEKLTASNAGTIPRCSKNSNCLAAIGSSMPLSFLMLPTALIHS